MRKYILLIALPLFLVLSSCDDDPQTPEEKIDETEPVLLTSLRFNNINDISFSWLENSYSYGSDNRQNASTLSYYMYSLQDQILGLFDLDWDNYQFDGNLLISANTLDGENLEKRTAGYTHDTAGLKIVFRNETRPEYDADVHLDIENGLLKAVRYYRLALDQTRPWREMRAEMASDTLAVIEIYNQDRLDSTLHYRLDASIKSAFRYRHATQEMFLDPFYMLMLMDRGLPLLASKDADLTTPDSTSLVYEYTLNIAGYPLEIYKYRAATEDLAQPIMYFDYTGRAYSVRY